MKVNVEKSYKQHVCKEICLWNPSIRAFECVIKYMKLMNIQIIA